VVIIFIVVIEVSFDSRFEVQGAQVFPDMQEYTLNQILTCSPVIDDSFGVPHQNGEIVPVQCFVHLLFACIQLLFSELFLADFSTSWLPGYSKLDIS